MTVKNKKTKKKRRRLTPITKLICLIMIGVSCFLLYKVGQEVRTTLVLRKQLAEAKEKLQEVQDENTYLNNEKEKLQNPDYVANYARGNYMLSKDGEQIFYLPENDNK
ncbi:MAG: septum formation initiator family protein [Solobacterium sp.]|jgi:cell division protein DivIC|nr:septum formation initiator family protein [Solobacterium sp.]